MAARAENEEAVDESEDIGLSAAQVIEMVAAHFGGLRPGEITIRMYVDEAKKAGEDLRYNQAACRLNSLVEVGLMTKREVVHEGARRMAYSWVSSDNDGRKTKINYE